MRHESSSFANCLDIGDEWLEDELNQCAKRVMESRDLATRPQVWRHRGDKQLQDVGDSDHVWCIGPRRDASDENILRLETQMWWQVHAVEHDDTERYLLSYIKSVSQLNLHE